MTALATIETARLNIQNLLDAEKTMAERNKLGQFATPTALASDVLEYAKRLLPKDNEIKFLDPALGTGSFYSALLRTVPSSQISDAIGIEIDDLFGWEARNLWSENDLRVITGDFTKISPPTSNENKPNLIICNPPYVRHHHLRSDEKLRLGALVKSHTGVKLSGLSGLYCYFIGIAHSWLANDGLAGWLIPSEFMDVNYGRELKNYLLNNVELIRIHRFDPNDVQFDDALVSSAVVWFRNRKPSSDHKVDFTYGGSLLQPKVSRKVSASQLGRDNKWTRHPFSSENENTSDCNGQLKISDLFTIKRGVATGSNKFFILTQEQIKEHNLPEKFLIPILPSARYLKTDEISCEQNGDPIIENKMYLLSCNLPEYEVKEKYPSLWRYLEKGVRTGISEQYLCRHRKPWYSQEIREPSPFLCTYMSRPNKDKSRLFRFIANHSKAIAANSFLMVYPKPLLAESLKNNPTLLKKIWRTLNDISPDSLSQEGRVYGGGLYKVEPRELANVKIDMPEGLLNDFARNCSQQLTLL